MKRKIEGCEVCEPIENLVSQLKIKGYELVSERCRDIHFNEVEIKMGKRIGNLELIPIKIEKIELHEEGFYFCTCHWSTVRFIENDSN